MKKEEWISCILAKSLLNHPFYSLAKNIRFSGYGFKNVNVIKL